MLWIGLCTLFEKPSVDHLWCWHLFINVMLLWQIWDGRRWSSWKRSRLSDVMSNLYWNWHYEGCYALLFHKSVFLFSIVRRKKLWLDRHLLSASTKQHNKHGRHSFFPLVALLFVRKTTDVNPNPLLLPGLLETCARTSRQRIHSEPDSKNVSIYMRFGARFAPCTVTSETRKCNNKIGSCFKRNTTWRRMWSTGSTRGLFVEENCMLKLKQ